MKTTLLVLTLNEIEGMKAIMPDVDSSLFDQILVIDGGSTDGTVEWARQHGYEVYVQKKKGIRFGYIEALPLIRGEIVVSFSPDGNCPTYLLPLLIDKVKAGKDLVIGSRYLGDAVSEDDDFVTAFGNWLFTRTVNLLHGGRYTDAMTIYRAFRREVIYQLDLHLDESYTLPERLFRTTISWEPLMSVRAAKAKLAIGEIPAPEPPRIGGVRKLQILRWGAAYYFQFWQELLRWKASPLKRKPMPVIRTKPAVTLSSDVPQVSASHQVLRPQMGPPLEHDVSAPPN
ncbi:MAG: glycosyltransferase family 2 protein [Bdellovibrionales bacterium]